MTFVTKQPSVSIPVFGVYLNVPVVLIEAQTGVAYAGQVGGIACLHPSVEGFPVFLEPGPWAGLTEISCREACGVNGLTEEVADQLEAAWPLNGEITIFDPIFVRLDRSRLSLGAEAWFPVTIQSNPLYCLGGYAGASLDGRRGFLLMPDNCD